MMLGICFQIIGRKDWEGVDVGKKSGHELTVLGAGVESMLVHDVTLSFKTNMASSIR